MYISTSGVRWLLSLLTVLGWAARAQAQVTADPVFFTDTTPITLTFDATQGSGGLANYTGDVYIYTGVITDQSSSPSDWKHVKNPNSNGYNNPIPEEKMTRISANKYTIQLTPRTVYPGLSTSSEVVQRLAMVFRGAGGTPEGKGPGNTDIFVNLSQSTTLQVAFTSPSNTSYNPTVVAANAAVPVAASASSASTLTLSLNGTQVAQATNATTISSSVTLTQPGVNTLTITATASGSTATATTTLLVPPTPPTAALPATAKADGITYLANGTSVILSLTAPNKSYVYVVGDFNNWQVTNAGLLNQTATVNSDAATGRWWVQIDGLTPGTEYAYQFLVDGNLRVADPYCDKVLDQSNDPYIPAVTYPNLKAYPAGKTTGIVSVLQPGQTPYAWTTTNFQRPARTNLVVYELHLRDFVARHDYQTLTDSLAYLKRLGVNAIELMPVNEFEGNDSWGYNPSFYFAPDKYYGTKTALKQFIDAAHARGIAVILDMVLNHSCSQSPMAQLYYDAAAGAPTADNPWYNQVAKHPANVCNDFNHESPYTRYFAKNVMKYWLQEYHIDGYRFDLSKGFTQVNSGTAGTTANYNAWAAYDASRVAIWTDYYNTIKATDATAYPILEHFADNSEDKELANLGMMPWGNMSYNYQQADMGYSTGWDLSYGYYQNRGYSQPNLMTYMESHDEERTMYKNLQFGNGSGSYSVKTLATALARNEMAAALFFAQPGPRMIWQFGEIGYDKSIFTCTDGTVPQPYGTDNCKTGPKPILWSYYGDANRRHLYEVYRAMITLKKQPAFAAATSSYVQDMGGSVKQSRLVGSGLSVVAFGNFDVTAQTAAITFPTTGTWYNYLTGSTLAVTNTSTSLSLQPGQYGVYVSQPVSLGTRVAEATAFKLSVAPNPASGTTTVTYELPAAATATITVQNLLGQTVRQLAPARQAAGTQTQALPLHGLAAGVYLVRLTADEQVQTTRLLVN